MRIITLHEEMVGGSKGVAVGAPAPVRTVLFTVERPGIEHKIFLSPASEALQPPRSAVTLRFSLADPSGKVILAERTEEFGVIEASRNGRADWTGKTFPFTPTVTGQHVLRVTPLVTDIPRIHVRIEDPEKRDGKRMPGY